MSRLQAGRRHTVRFTLNGKPCVGEVEPRLLLTDFLRHQIGSTGTHVGCEHGVCGACTVEIDGKPARACLTLAASSAPWRGSRLRPTGSAFCRRR
jgi:2-furoyl-CoA dehydrogenase 2Fe-2S iron sulfur subunit